MYDNQLRGMLTILRDKLHEIDLADRIITLISTRIGHTDYNELN